MQKILFLLLIFVFFPSILLTANTLEDKRRIEEEKRESLCLNEFQIFSPEKDEWISESGIDMDYFSKVLLKEVTFRSDGFAAVVIFLGVEDSYKDINSQIEFLKENKFIPKNMFVNTEPDKPLRKGLAAYMFFRALNMQGGVILRLFGPNERYALKELVYQGIMAPGYVDDVVSGEELVLIISRSADYIVDKKIKNK